MSDMAGLINALRTELDNRINNVMQRIERLENLRKEELREEGREEIRKIVREAAELPDLSNQAREKLVEKGILLKQS